MIVTPQPQNEVFEIPVDCRNHLNNRLGNNNHNFSGNSSSEFTNPNSINYTKRRDVLSKHSVNIGNITFSDGVLLVKRRFYKQIRQSFL